MESHSPPARVGLLGAAGRMGKMLVQEIEKTSRCELTAAVVRAGSEDVGVNVADTLQTGDAEAAFAACEVLIDFSVAEAAPLHIALARQYKKPLLMGTTGLPANTMAELEKLAQSVPVFYAANMSVGMTLLTACVEKAARILGFEDFDIEIFEAHHRHKVDAPSGTALMLAKAAAKGRGMKVEDALVTHQGGARVPGKIGMSVSRGGDIVGEHAVVFAGLGEKLMFTHRASDRAVFARGALHAALWLLHQGPGFYSMKDMVDF